MFKKIALALALSTFPFAGWQAGTAADRRPAAAPAPTPKRAVSDAFARAVALYDDGQPDEAETAFRELVAKEPKNADALFYLGKISADRKDYKAAAPFFEQAAKIDFKSPEKILGLADNQRALKQFDRAVVQYQKAMGFAPDNPASYFGLGLTYLGLNNKIAAGQQMRKLETLDKDLAEQLKAAIEKK